jgi:putative oxidoreductase
MESGQVNTSAQNRARPSYARIGRFFARLVLGGLFASAGALKIYDPGAFAIELERYQLFPWKIGVVIANYLPWLELLSGLCLFLKWFERGALLLATMLLGVFTLALASALVRGLNIDCGCFGHVLMSTGTVVPILRNVVLLLLAGMLWTKY